MIEVGDYCRVKTTEISGTITKVRGNLCYMKIWGNRRQIRPDSLEVLNKTEVSTEVTETIDEQLKIWEVSNLDNKRKITVGHDGGSLSLECRNRDNEVTINLSPKEARAMGTMLNIAATDIEETCPMCNNTGLVTISDGAGFYAWCKEGCGGEGETKLSRQLALEVYFESAEREFE